MSTFVLVHGAWQSTGTWDLLAPLLKEQGHKVITPVLIGLGTDQNHLSPDITLRQHINDVSNVLSRLQEVILVGHSYAGMIVCGVVENQPRKVQRLVFVDAFIPEHGQCVLDLLPSEIGVHFRSVAQSQGMVGVYRAGRPSSTSGDSSQALRVILCVPDSAILVCAALRKLFFFRLIGRPAFLPPTSPALPSDILPSRFSSHLLRKLVLAAGM